MNSIVRSPVPELSNSQPAASTQVLSMGSNWPHFESSEKENELMSKDIYRCKACNKTFNISLLIINAIKAGILVWVCPVATNIHRIEAHYEPIEDLKIPISHLPQS